MTNLMLMTTFKDRLRLAVKHSGLSARDLARKAGFRSQTHISALLSSKREPNPTNDTMQKIASAAGVSFEWLATGMGNIDSGTTRGEPLSYLLCKGWQFC